jgi:RNA polymerase sigma-70 factor (ECF subfamily)
LENSLNHLPITYRTVFILREIAGFSTTEIAALINISSININLQLSCAKTMIKNKLANQIFSASIFEYNVRYADSIALKVLCNIHLIDKDKGSV